jgi:hypothetical protein
MRVVAIERPSFPSVSAQSKMPPLAMDEEAEVNWSRSKLEVDKVAF